MNPEILGFTYRFEPAPEGATGAPTLLLLHGTGGTEDDLIEIGRELMPGANLLSPRGKVEEQGMPRFFRRLAEGVFDEEDLRFRTDELADFVMEASNALGFDGAAVTAVGFSNGANIAASLLLLRPEALAGAALWRAMVPLVPDTAPDLAGRRVLMCEGMQDPIVPRGNAERLAMILQMAGADVTLAWQPNGHTLTARDIDLTRDWLAAEPSATA